MKICCRFMEQAKLSKQSVGRHQSANDGLFKNK